MTLNVLHWSSLSQPERRAALRRPAQSGTEDLHARVRAIIDDVRARGDDALIDLSLRFDGAALSALEVTSDEFASAERSLGREHQRAKQ